MLEPAGRNFTAKGNYRLLANTTAHQWFGTMVSPATKNDWWLNDGGARYSEALYVEHVAGEAGVPAMEGTSGADGEAHR